MKEIGVLRVHWKEWIDSVSLMSLGSAFSVKGRYVWRLAGRIALFYSPWVEEHRRLTRSPIVEKETECMSCMSKILGWRVILYPWHQKTGLHMDINPLAAPACKISGLNDARTRLQTVYFPVLQHLFSMQCVLMQILSKVSAKRKTKKPKDLKFHTFMGRFQITSWQWRG